jgi:hypothetical protein
MKLFDDTKHTAHEMIMWNELKELKEAVIDLRKITVGGVWLLIINAWLIVGVVLLK